MFDKQTRQIEQESGTIPITENTHTDRYINTHTIDPIESFPD